MKRFMVFFVCLVIILGLFLNSSSTALSVKNSLELCINTLIPSLFPFMAISLFMSFSGAGDIFSFILSPFTKYFLHIPKELGQTVFFSLIGGYPAGARLLGSLVNEKRISPFDAGTLLGFCVSPGPAFVVLAVGKGMFGSAKTGVIFLISQLCASLLTGALLCRKNPLSTTKIICKTNSLYISFIQAVSQSSSGILTIVSYVVLVSAILGSFGELNNSNTALLLFSLSEVTSGCSIAASLGGILSLMLASFLLSFGGISVCCQIAALAAEYSIPIRTFVISRFACGGLSALFTFVLIKLFPEASQVFAQVSRPIAASSGSRVVGAVCLCVMIAITFSKASLSENVDF